MLKVDNLTLVHSQGKFARICVKFDLQRELFPTFTALGKDFNLEYEDLHLICFGCGKYGHRLNDCPDSIIQSSHIVGEAVDNHGLLEKLAAPVKLTTPVMTEETQNPNLDISHNQQIPDSIPVIGEVSEGSIFGPWMIAKRTIKRNKTGARYLGANSQIKDLDNNMHIQSGDLITHGSRYDILETVTESLEDACPIQPTITENSTRDSISKQPKPHPTSIDNQHKVNKKDSRPIHKAQPRCKQIVQSKVVNSNPLKVVKQGHVPSRTTLQTKASNAISDLEKEVLRIMQRHQQVL